MSFVLLQFAPKAPAKNWVLGKFWGRMLLYISSFWVPKIFTGAELGAELGPKGRMIFLGPSKV